MKRKLAVILAATMVLNSFTVPAFAEDYADVVAVEDDGYVEDITVDEYVDYEVEDTADDAEVFDDTDFVDDIEVEEGFEEDAEEVTEENAGSDTHDKDATVDYTWVYRDGKIQAKYTIDGATYFADADNQEPIWADRTDLTDKATYTTKNSEIYKKIIEETHTTQVTVGDGTTIWSWNSYITTSFEDKTRKVSSGDKPKTFYLYDAVLAGLEEGQTIKTITTEDVTLPATCRQPGKKDIYTFYLLPGHEKEYKDNDYPAAEDVVSITKTIGTVNPDTVYGHSWGEMKPTWVNIYNTTAVDTLKDPNQPGWYALKFEAECPRCGEKKTFYYGADKEWAEASELEKNGTVTLTNGQTVTKPEWYKITPDGQKVYYSYYVPAATATQLMSFARDIKNIAEFITADGTIKLTVTYTNGQASIVATVTSKGTSADLAEVNNANNVAGKTGMLEKGFYAWTKPGKALSTDTAKTVLVDCDKKGTFTEYVRLSNSGTITDDSSYVFREVAPHHTNLVGDAKVMIPAEVINNVLVRDKTTNAVLWDPTAPGASVNNLTAVYNYKQFDLTNNKVNGKAVKYFINGENTPKVNNYVALGYVFAGDAKVINLMCDRTIKYYQITRCRCAQHAYSTDVAYVWNEIESLRKEFTLDKSTVHTHGQILPAVEYTSATYHDVKQDGDKKVSLYELMVGMRSGGYLTHELDKVQNWQSYREFYKEAHYPTTTKYFANFPVVRIIGNQKSTHYFRVDLTALEENDNYKGLVKMTGDTSTCKDDGKSNLAYKCSVCKQFTDDREVDVKAHGEKIEAIGQEVKRDPASCTHPGTIYWEKKCLICGRVLEENTKTIAQLEHTNDINHDGKSDVPNTSKHVIKWSNNVVVIDNANVQKGVVGDIRYAFNTKTSVRSFFESAEAVDGNPGNYGIVGYAAKATVYTQCDTCGANELISLETIGKRSPLTVTVKKLVDQSVNSAGRIVPGEVVFEATFAYTDASGKTVTAKEVSGSYAFFDSFVSYQERVNPQELIDAEKAAKKAAAEKAAAEALEDPTADKIEAAKEAIIAAEAVEADTTKATQDLKAAEAKAKETARAAVAKGIIDKASELSENSTDAEIKAVEDAIKGADMTAGEAALANQYVQAAKDAKAKKVAEEEAKKAAEEEAKKRAAELVAAQKVATAKTAAENSANAALTAATAALSNPTDASIKVAKDAVTTANATINTSKAAGADTSVAARTVALANTTIATAEKQKKAVVPTITFGNKKVKKALVPGGHITNRIILKVGQTLKIKAKASDGSKVYYRAINDKLISCSKSGKVKAKKVGRTRVLVTTKNGAKYEVLFRVKK